jgi:ABC-2 type transport system ATP-binding protein
MSLSVSLDGKTAVQLQSVSYSYGARAALKDVSLTIPTGAIYGLLGPNGAGKSTTLKVLRGRLRPSGGTVVVLGEKPWSAPPSWRSRIGWVGEQPGHYERLSARSNLLFFARLLGAAPKRVDELLAVVGLADRASDTVRGLSRGMRQRLALARALLGSPELLFLDEPTAGLDLVVARQVRQLIRDYGRQGGTVVVTTHDLREAEEICDLVGILEAGVMRGSQSPQAWCQEILGEELPPPSERVSLERVYWKLYENSQVSQNYPVR